MGQIRRDKEDPNRLEGYTEKIRNWILLRFMSFDSSLQWQTDAGEPAHAAVEISAHSAFDLRITMEKDLDVLGWKSVSVDLRTDYSTTMSKVRVLKLFPISAKLKEEDSEPEKELGGLTQEDADRVLKLGKKRKLRVAVRHVPKLRSMKIIWRLISGLRLQLNVFDQRRRVVADCHSLLNAVA